MQVVQLFNPIYPSSCAEAEQDVPTREHKHNKRRLRSSYSDVKAWEDSYWPIYQYEIALDENYVERLYYSQHSELIRQRSSSLTPV